MKRKKPYIIAAVLALLVLAADSRWHLSVSEYTLFFDSLPPGAEGRRLILLSDLHGRRFGRENRRLAERVKALKPDLIALTGDFVSPCGESSNGISAARELVTQLEGAAPIYWVNGNHEWNGSAAAYAMEEMLTAHGVHCLDDAFEPLLLGGSRIIVAGADDKNTWREHIGPQQLAADIRRLYPDDFVLLLKHRNDSVTEQPGLPVDLVLSGHAHGGIVRLPFIGGLLNTNRTFGAEYEYGIYDGRDYKLAVSRGLGNSIPVPRLLNRPEIVVIRLFSSEKR